MHRRDAIAEGILATKPALARYLAGFDDTNHTAQAVNLPNHVAWCLGHLALTMHRVAERFDGKPPSSADFFDPARSSPGTARPRDRFDTESVRFGSTPAADPGRYPSMARCIEVYNNGCDRVAGAVRAAEDQTLDRMQPWGPVELPLWLLAMRMIYHNGDHTGQIAGLRRALGMKSIFA